jgi:class 3 adenylate cyclase
MAKSAESLPFADLYRACRKNLLTGTLLSIAPAAAFYYFVFPYTARQLAILGFLAFVDLVALLPIDLAVLRWSLQPVKLALEPKASAEIRREGLRRLLDAPWMVLLRVYLPHSVVATAVINLLVIGANRYYSLGVSPSTFPLYWILNLTVVPFAHAVYEFAAFERTAQPFAKSLATSVLVDSAGARRFTLSHRMRLFFPMLAVAPVAIVLVTIVIRSQGASAEIDPALLRDVSAVGACVFVLFLFLMQLLGQELRSQTGLLVGAVDRLAEGDWTSRADIYSTSEFGQLATHVNQTAVSLEERERLRELFGAYMTPEVASTLLAQGKPATAVEKRFVAAMFLDVRDFTKFSSEHPAEIVVAVLNRILSEAVTAIAAEGGTVNKYLGDGLLALFGAPTVLENPCRSALKAALECSRRIAALNHLFAATGTPVMRIGIGIHCGEVVVGSIGSAKHKLEYTAIGDAINVASRIEQLNKTLATEILASEQVIDAAGPEWSELAGSASIEMLKGKDLPVTVYPIERERNGKAAGN